MSSKSQPNILWVCSDQQRYDTIRALGNQYINTPVLDGLVREGTSFLRSYVQSQICTPSRASFMTGRYPASHHVHRNGTDYFPPSEKLVSRMFQDAGYMTGIIGKHHLSKACDRIELMQDDGYTFARLGDSHPIGRAYDDWLRHKHGIKDPLSVYPDLLKSSARDYGAGLPMAMQQAAWWAEEAISFIQQPHGKPWFLNLNAVDPHPPFYPAPEFLSRYDPATLPLPLFRESDLGRDARFGAIDTQWKQPYDIRQYDESKDIDQRGIPLENRNLYDFPPDVYDVKMMMACYYAMIEMVDDRLGAVLAALEQSGQADNTIVVFISDHGEMMGDHGMMYKGCRFFEGLVRVPTIFRWPGKYQAGLRSQALIELVDVVPTLLDAAGIATPYFVQGKSLDGLLRGTQPADVHKDVVICEFNDALGGMPNANHATMSFDGRYKTCVYHGTGVGEIFDLQEDPGEFECLWSKPEFQSTKTDLLHKHMDAIMASSWAGIERTGLY